MTDRSGTLGTRRGVLTAIGTGVAGLSGCADDAPSSPTDAAASERPDTTTAPASTTPRTAATESSPTAATPDLAFVGTRAGPDEDGIFTLEVGADGSLERTGAVGGGNDPSFLALDHAGDHLYAVNTIADGAAIAYDLDPATGELERRNRVSVGGGGPAHCSVDPTDQCLLTAQYGAGSVSVLPKADDGSLEEPSTVLEHSGSGANPGRQSAPHPHSIQPGPNNEYVYVPDLGTDQVYVYAFDPDAATIEAAETGHVETNPGAGPRHMDFHPNGEYAYVINELDSTITAYEHDAETGGLQAIATVDTLGEDYDGQNTTADIHVHPSGEYLYGSNRGHNSIAIYELGDDGKPQFVETESTQGDWPRNFALDPAGDYCYAENARSDSIVTFAIGEDGTLAATGDTLEIPSPVCMKFL
jgi:6-phosphogluconolactonase